MVTVESSTSHAAAKSGILALIIGSYIKVNVKVWTLAIAPLT